MKTAIGVIIALAIGAACRWFNLPVPAPPQLIGMLLVAAITVGYVGTDRWMRNDRPGSQARTDHPAPPADASGQGSHQRPPSTE